jgi:hypothetical protein
MERWVKVKEITLGLILLSPHVMSQLKVRYFYSLYNLPLFTLNLHFCQLFTLQLMIFPWQAGPAYNYQNTHLIYLTWIDRERYPYSVSYVPVHQAVRVVGVRIPIATSPTTAASFFLMRRTPDRRACGRSTAHQSTTTAPWSRHPSNSLVIGPSSSVANPCTTRPNQSPTEGCGHA